jgi:solute carrier family 25 protein 14/30
MKGGDKPVTKQRSQLQTDVLKALLAGGASIISATATHPIDLIKIRMQLQPTLPDGTKKYSNMIKGIILVSKEEGIRGGIYKGIEGAWMRESVYSTLRLGLYEPIKRNLGVTKESNMAWKFLAGSCSGLIGSTIANPFDLMKVRMQASKEARPISWHANEIYSHGGVLGFWKGVGPTCIRAMKMNGTKLSVYDTIKHGIIDRGYLKDGIACQFWASVVAGFFQTVVTTPIDNIKTRIMN